jgi:predicted nucleotidyltransferase
MDANVRNTINEYFKSKPIQKAWVFGSVARGEEHPDSDVDILVSFVPGAKMGLSYFGMICDLEDLLHRPVDLVVEGDLLPFAVESANKDKILVYEQQVEGYLGQNDI